MLVPVLDEEDNTTVWKPMKKDEHIIPQFLHGSRGKLMCFITKKPIWSSKHNAYFLNFGNKMIAPSIKNFQLISPGNGMLNCNHR